MPPFTGTATPRATVGIHLPAAAPRFVARIFGRHISLGDPGVADRNPAGPSPSLMRCATASTSADLVMSSRKTRHQIRVSPARSVHCRRGSAGDRPRQTLASANVRHRPRTPPQPGLSSSDSPQTRLRPPQLALRAVGRCISARGCRCARSTARPLPSNRWQVDGLSLTEILSWTRVGISPSAWTTIISPLASWV
jgi:hypothetical protein